MTDQEIAALYHTAEAAVSDRGWPNTREYGIALTRKILELATPAPTAPSDAIAPLSIYEMLAIHDNNNGDWIQIARAVEDHYLTKLEAASVADGMVPVPTNADQAHGMVNMGLMWLKEYAPERLLATPAPSERNAVLDEVAEYLTHLRDSSGDRTEHEKGSTFALNLAAKHIRGMKTEAPEPTALAALREVAQTLAWQSLGEARGFSDHLLSVNDALALAKSVLSGEAVPAAPVAVFDGYIDGAAVIQWRGKQLPAGTLLYAAPAPTAPSDALLLEARELLYDAAEPDAGKPGYLGAQWDVDALALITKIDAA